MSLIVKAANRNNYDTVLERSLEDLCFSDDLDFAALLKHLLILVDGVKESDSVICNVTIIQTVCSGMNSNSTNKQILTEVHKLLYMYLTVSVTTLCINF